jgi:hypothetical protein
MKKKMKLKAYLRKVRTATAISSEVGNLKTLDFHTQFFPK